MHTQTKTTISGHTVMPCVSQLTKVTLNYWTAHLQSSTPSLLSSDFASRNLTCHMPPTSSTSQQTWPTK